MKTVLFLVSLFLLPITYGLKNSNGCGKSPESNPGSTTTFSYWDGKYSRTYIVHVPLSYNNNNGQPMFLALPGYSITANYMANNFQMISQSEEYGYIAVFLQGTKPLQQSTNYWSWNDLSCTQSPGIDGPTCNLGSGDHSETILPQCKDNGNINLQQYCNWCNCESDDISYITSLISHLTTNYCINIEKIYATGYSNGGMMTHRLGVSLTNILAGIAPMHGQMHIGFNEKPLNGINIPIFGIWGTRDTTLPGANIESSDGWYYLPMLNVVDTFAMNNGCNIYNGLNIFKTISDGIRSFGCQGYDIEHGCNSFAIICSWAGSHVYPVQGNNNFGLRAAWQYLSMYSKVNGSRIVKDDEISEK